MYEASRLLRLPDVQRLTGLSKSSIYRLESTDQFPPRVRLSERAIAWHEQAIVDWINQRTSVTLRGSVAESTRP